MQYSYELPHKYRALEVKRKHHVICTGNIGCFDLPWDKDEIVLISDKSHYPITVKLRH